MPGSNNQARPTDSAAALIAIETCGEPVRSCTRFSTGLRNWVFDVALASGRSVVVRLGVESRRVEFAGGLFWAEQLREVGVPVAEVLAVDLDAVFPFTVLERLPGTDLGNLYDSLTNAQRLEISTSVTSWQQRTASLPLARGYGYATSFDAPLDTWPDVLSASLGRSRERMAEACVVDPVWADRVAHELDGQAARFDDVEPRAFLHDATTKNVIVDNGQAHGLVDIDELCFGDPLWLVALTRTSLLAADRDPTYVDPQLAALDPDGLHERRFELYTALHALGFLSELGRSFNREVAPAVDEQYREHLEQIVAVNLR